MSSLGSALSSNYEVIRLHLTPPKIFGLKMVFTFRPQMERIILSNRSVQTDAFTSCETSEMIDIKQMLSTRENNSQDRAQKSLMTRCDHYFRQLSEYTPTDQTISAHNQNNNALFGRFRWCWRLKLITRKREKNNSPL